MTGVLVIARYELSRRWGFLILGFVLGVLPLMFAPPEMRAGSLQLAETLLVLGVVLSWTVAFATGMSLVGRPLHDGRMSFYFTRPMAAPAIATGKILGGIGSIAGMQLVLALPLAGHEDLTRDGGWRLAVALAFVGIAFLAVGLVVGILARSRSRWFIVDALGASVVSALCVAMFAMLSAYKTRTSLRVDLDGWTMVARIHLVDRLLYALVIAAVVAVIAAAIAAVAIGRTDRERVHRALSFTLWPALTATALAGLALAHWGLPS